MKTELGSLENNLDDITGRICFYAIIGTYYVPAFTYRAIKQGINFIDKKTSHLVD